MNKKQIRKRLISCGLIGLLLISAINFSSAFAAASNSQTEYENILEFQNARWAEIQSEVFEGVSSLQTDVTVLKDLELKENPYFYWNTTDTAGLTKWDGSSSDAGITTETATYHYEDSYVHGADGSSYTSAVDVSYTVYNVSTPAQFRWALEKCAEDGTSETHIKVNITEDLDFNGQIWTPLERAYSSLRYGSIYIEGNGHTLYNLKIYGAPTSSGGKSTNTGLFGTLNKRLMVKNLGFNSTMLLAYSKQAGLLYGTMGYASDEMTNAMMYLYNVHSDRAYMQCEGKLGGLIGQGSYSGNAFIENCSTSNYYMYGTDHIAGLMSYTQLGTTAHQVAVKYNAEMPETPEAFVYQNERIYPVVVENSYSVDSELFSTGSDSGAFISCGQSLIVRNSFTNNSIYASQNTGGFIGRCAYPADARPGKMYDDAGNRNIGNYFENCYSSGLVEGNSAMGGFTGLDNTYRGLENMYVDPDIISEKTDGDQMLAIPKFGTTADSAKTVANSTEAGSTVYKNCYSTAMVGMDYAGKYVGGFIGLDENYTLGTTVNINGTNVVSNGSFYINCYAAGEVGNISTVTDREIGSVLEISYIENDEGIDRSAEILYYYPTGGFIGVLSPDIYWYDTTYNNMSQFDGIITYSSRTYTTVLPETIKDYHFGYFENCFYDMQTTAMHEMAVGLRDVVAYSDTDIDNKESYSIEGIKGVYTETSEVKGVDGLTDFPTGPDGYAMDTSKGSSTTWNYETGYYPQLQVFMHFDLDESGNLITSDKQAVTDASASPFHIPVVENATDGTQSCEVKGFDSKSEIVTAYRYSQASTSTVFLNHWDYRMNTTDGTLSTDNNWVCGLGKNQMTLNEQTQFWEKTYTGLAAGQYNFKIQANDTMTYNYGSDKFDGRDCVLEVPQDNCNVTIKFRYNDLGSNNYQIFADIYNSENVLLQENVPLGGNTTQAVAEIWTLVGELPQAFWEPTAEVYDMQQQADDVRIYSVTESFTPNMDENGNYVETTFHFKVTKDHAWNESYGLGGGSDNMSFTINEPCDITFDFNSKTRITTITGTPAEAITNIATEESAPIDFDGYSVIGTQELTGYNWLQSGSELAAAEKGKLVETAEGSGIYTVTFENVPMGQNYAYKVIEDAIDEGANSYFYLQAHPVNTNGTCSVTFTYNESLGDVTVSAVIDGKEYVTQSLDASFFTVLGAEGLTGYHWLGDMDHPTPPQTEESKEQYKQESIENGRMEQVVGTALYRKTFYDVPAGTYGFKVAADGSLDLSYGANDSEENYEITLTKTADVEITFNKDKGTISVKTSPTGALDSKVYVVTGTEDLMGKAWDTTEAVMTFNEEEGVYEYTRQGVYSNANYAFKVIEQGIDSGNNISFYLGGAKDTYNLRFTYNPKNGVTAKYAYDVDSGDDVTAAVMEAVQITSYSVLGDKGLTGSSWLGLNDDGTPGTEEAEKKATADGAMTKNANGTYTKVYKNIPVGVDGEVKSYAFKIAANGNWESGISYGDGEGGNYILLLNGDVNNVTSCDVTIHFNPSTEEITIETSPVNCNLAMLDDSNFEWFVVGDYQLVSYENFEASATVYDTVRDITSGFEFTSGRNSSERGVSWGINAERNNISNFYSQLGNGTGFSLDYTVDGNNATGTFNTPVIELLLEVIKDEYQGARADNYVSQYYCESFMPGKQWLTVNSVGLGYSDAYNAWKSKYLAYTEYLNDLEEFNTIAENYYVVLGDQLSDKTPAGLVSYIRALKNSADSDEVNYYNKLTADYGDVLAVYSAVATEVANPGDAPTVSSEEIVGSRNLRLIPTAYLEAGNDARVKVLRENSDAAASNLVEYDKNGSEYITFTGVEGVPHSYYNFAFTAGYAITDKVGLGIYDNYINQDAASGDYGVKKYSEKPIRNHDDTAERHYGTYYAMTSAFTESASYVDTAKEKKGLIADTLVQQSIIGSSYDYKS